jgi:hypothetical protein
MDDNRKVAVAKQRVEAMVGFYIHLLVYALVNALLVAVNVASGDAWWVQWPILGWGAGVLAHALMVFGQMPRTIRRWQVRKIKTLADQM